MVNLGLNFSSLLGIILAVSGAGLYFLRSWQPKLARDHDIFFAAIGLLCGGILLFQGWRLDPILAFGQFLLTGSAIFFAVESVRLRGVTTTKARERAPIVDEERYVSDVYRVDAELDEDLDEIEPVDRYTPASRQIRGSREVRPARSEAYSEEGYRTRPTSSRRSNVERSSSERNSPERSIERNGTERSRSRTTASEDWGEPAIMEDRPPRKRRPRSEGRPSGVVDDYDALESEDRPSCGRPRRSGDRPEPYQPSYNPDQYPAPEPKRQTPPPEDSQYRYSPSSREVVSSDYAEYSPVDYDEESDRSI